MTKEAKKAAKLEKKLKILTGGYQVCATYIVFLTCLVHKHVHTAYMHAYACSHHPYVCDTVVTDLVFLVILLVYISSLVLQVLTSR